MGNTVTLVCSMLAACLIAVLSGLGVGSGGLLVIWLTGVAGVDPILARSLNILFFVCSASAAFLFHLKRRKMNFKLILWIACFALLGTLMGVWISGFLDAYWLKKIFGGVMVVAGGVAFCKAFSKKAKNFSKTPLQIPFFML